MAGLNTRTVQAIPVDENGNPIMGGLFSVGRDEYGRTDNYATGELPYHPMLPGQGAPQGTKHDRGGQPEFSINEPWPGPIDQVAYRSQSPTRLAAGELPPANYGSSSAYVPDDNAIVRALNPNGTYSDPLTAIAGATSQPLGPPPNPAPVMIPAPTIAASDPWEGMRIPTGNEPVMRPGLVTGTPGSGGGESGLDTPTGYVPKTPRQLATGMGGLRDNQLDTYTKRQQQIANTGSFTLNSGASVKVGDKVRATDGSIKTVMPDGTFR